MAVLLVAVPDAGIVDQSAERRVAAESSPPAAAADPAAVDAGRRDSGPRSPVLRPVMMRKKRIASSPPAAGIASVLLTMIQMAVRLLRWQAVWQRFAVEFWATGMA